LKPETRNSDSESDEDPQQQKYDPFFLDDPEMKISKDRTVIKQVRPLTI